MILKFNKVITLISFYESFWGEVKERDFFQKVPLLL